MQIGIERNENFFIDNQLMNNVNNCTNPGSIKSKSEGVEEDVEEYVEEHGSTIIIRFRNKEECLVFRAIYQVDSN